MIGRAAWPASRVTCRTAPADLNLRADLHTGDHMLDNPADVEAAVEPVGTSHGPGPQPLGAGAGGHPSTMSTNTRRRSLAAAALITVRSAPAVRPPRPITEP